jgi:hypothetical protein
MAKNAFASANPSDVAMKSMTVLGEAIMCFESPDAGISSSKKNATGTCRIWEMCCRRPAPIRLMPFRICEPAEM